MDVNFRVAIVGGGSSTHLLAPLLASQGVEVSILTSRPNDWNNEVSCLYCDDSNEIQSEIMGTIEAVSDKAKDIIPYVDAILLCMPVYAYRDALKDLAPHIKGDKKVFIGTVYGQGGFDWMLKEAFGDLAARKVIGFAVGLLPWICRIKEYGKIGITYGPKDKNVVALTEKEEFDNLNDKLLKKMSLSYFGSGQFYLAENFISLTLSVDNQIIHPSRCFALSNSTPQGWDENSIPYFYRDFDDKSALVLKYLDDEFSSIRKAINGISSDNYEYMLDYLSLERFSYGSFNTDIKESFVSSKTLGAILPPVKLLKGSYFLDKDHRFFVDDINYGLCIAKWFGARLNIDTPAIDEIIAWASDLKGLNVPDFITNSLSDEDAEKYGMPTCYGINSLNEALGILA